MACGTPVLALSGGSVPEIVRDGISGYVCRSVSQLAKRAMDLHIEADVIRQYVEENFSLQRMVARHQELYKDATDTQRKVA